jgi:hypothetical protein
MIVKKEQRGKMQSQQLAHLLNYVTVILSISSILVLVLGGGPIYYVCQALLLAWAAIKTIINFKINLKSLHFAILLGGSHILSLILSNQLSDLDVLVKTANIILILIFADSTDLKIIFKVGRFFATISLVVTIAIYFSLIDLNIGLIYDYLHLFGRPVNSGIFFELNYAAMVALVFLTS